MITRRELTNLLLAPALQSPEPDPPALRDLPLDPELRQQLAEGAKRAVQQAGWLQELPLDGVAPGFVFLAR